MYAADWFDQWLEEFVYLLHSRNHTAESLIFIYQTISRIYFPANFSTLDS